MVQSCVIRSVKKKPNFDVNRLILDVVRTRSRTVPYTYTHTHTQVISAEALKANETSAVMWLTSVVFHHQRSHNNGGGEKVPSLTVPLLRPKIVDDVDGVKSSVDVGRRCCCRGKRFLQL